MGLRVRRARPRRIFSALTLIDEVLPRMAHSRPAGVFGAQRAGAGMDCSGIQRIMRFAVPGRDAVGAICFGRDFGPSP